MTIKRFTEKMLLDGLDAYAAHADELAVPRDEEFSLPKTIGNSHGVAALRWMLEHQGELGLTPLDVAVLAGAKDEQESRAWLSEERELPEAAVKKLGLFLGIYKGLVEITPAQNKQMAFEWFQRATDVFTEFRPLSIRDYLLQNPSEEALEAVNRSVKGLAR